MKRIIDIIGSLILVIITSPFMLLIAIAIKLTSKGPVFYKPTRVGLRGKPYVMYKFRTMVVDAPKTWLERFDPETMGEFVFQEKDDPRITSIGRFLRKTSLDELPNFFNVLGGSMSLVGPRPEEPEIAAHYDDNAKRRLDVKPGITGLAQVSGRGDLPLAETIAKDLDYVDHHSTWLDLKILLKTPFVALRGKGAF